MSWTLAIVGAYLLGSVSFSYLLVRFLRDSDIRSVGSGNAGATNVLRTAGRAPATMVLAMDIAKGALPVALAVRFGAPEWVVAGVAVASVCGHVFPVFLGFRGGKGVATAAGALGVLTPLPVLIGGGLFAVVVWATRTVSLGSVTAVASVPAIAALCDSLKIGTYAGRWRVAGAAFLSLMIIYKHKDNLRRMRQGKERKLGGRAE